MPSFYWVCGLYLAVNQSLPGLRGLAQSPERSDVQIFLGQLPVAWNPPPGDNTAEQVLVRQSCQGQLYWQVVYRDGAEFVIDESGARIWVIWPTTSTREDVATYLLGPILGFVLRLRGVLCLHASAIAIQERAIALVGTSGAGKSTTAATLAQRGYAILSDDILALVPQGEDWLVQPAYPQLRLWSTAVTALYGHPEALPCLTPTWEKRYLDLTQPGYEFQAAPLPLAAIYLLQPRSDEPTTPRVEPATAASTLVELVANTYANTLLDKPMRGEEFQVLGQLVQRIPQFRVFPHSDPQFLPQLGDVILASLKLN